nr:hypothetical protein [Sphingomonas japonica]
MTRAERLALIAAALASVLVCGWLTLPHATRIAPQAEVAPLALPPAPPPGDAAFRRALFAPAALAVEDAPADAPALAGIVGRIDADAVALVHTSLGETRTLKPGEAVDGWTLQSLAIDAAYFTRGNARVRVPLPAGDDAGAPQ